jgi:hypothetical protein
MYRGTLGVGIAAWCVFWACVAMVAIPGCGGKTTRNQTIERYSDELRESVSSHVQDEARKGQMLLTVDQLEKLQLRFSQETVDFVAAYRKLNTEYDSPRSAFDQLFADYNAKRIRARTDALDLHFQLAALASEDGWDAIGKAEGKLYEKVNEAPVTEEHGK